MIEEKNRINLQQDVGLPSCITGFEEMCGLQYTRQPEIQPLRL
jgi:hypothetical protein